MAYSGSSDCRLRNKRHDVVNETVVRPSEAKMLLFVLLAVVACVGGWLYGEIKNNQLARVLGAIGCILVFSGIAATISGLHTALSVGIPMSTAVHEYLDASTTQLQNGHVDFVVNEFNGFKERAHVTYETGAFLDAVASETQRMTAGPSEP